jgi:hypothetical protein
MNKYVLAAVLMVCLVNFAAAKETEDLQELFGKFTAWKVQHKKNYASSEEEFYRFKVWMDTKKYIETADVEHKMKLNKFSDFTTEEFAERYLMKNVPEVDLSVGEQAVFTHDAPAEVDWKAKG